MSSTYDHIRSVQFNNPHIYIGTSTVKRYFSFYTLSYLLNLCAKGKIEYYRYNGRIYFSLESLRQVFIHFADKKYGKLLCAYDSKATFARETVTARKFLKRRKIYTPAILTEFKCFLQKRGGDSSESHKVAMLEHWADEYRSWVVNYLESISNHFFMLYEHFCRVAGVSPQFSIYTLDEKPSELLTVSPRLFVEFNHVANGAEDHVPVL